MASHKDFLGQELQVDDTVAGIFPSNESIHLFRVTGFTPKKLKVEYFGLENETSKFPYDVIKLDPAIIAQHVEGTPRDALGQKLEVGDYVFGSDGSYIDPVIFKILMFHPRKAVLEKVISERSYVPKKLRLTTDLIKVDAKLLTMYKLTKGNDDEI